MSPRLSVDVSEAVWQALVDEQERSGDSRSEIVERVLTESLAVESHSIFQVSTSNALVQGVFRGAVTVAGLKERGDLGLGTFEGLDGELIMLDGVCYRATLDGALNVVDDDARVPFAVVTRFHEDVRAEVGEGGTMSSLTELLDQLRPSENLFAAIKAEGQFRALTMRAACPAAVGEGLVEAVEHQSEYDAGEVDGTLVGFWAPVYAGTVNIPGYHFHFVSDDRNLGGHVLGLETGHLEIGVQVQSELHLAMPSTPEFLDADLSGSHEDALHRAETGVGSTPPTKAKTRT